MEETAVSTASDTERRVESVLDELGLPYDVLDCDPDFADTAAFCERYGYAPDECGNTILVASKKEPKQHAACIVRGSARLDVNHTVRRLMGVRRLSFASAEETAAVTGMLVGGVTPFALPSEIPVYVDASVAALDSVILGSGSRSSKIRVSPAVFDKLPSAQVVEGLSMG